MRKKPETPEVLLARFQKRTRLLTPEFIESLDIPHMPPLTATERRANLIKETVERTVENGYFPELIHASTGQDPVIATFMTGWREDEAGHANALEQVRIATTPPNEVIPCRPSPIGLPPPGGTAC